MKRLSKIERQQLNLVEQQQFGIMRIDWVSGQIANSWIAKEAMEQADSELTKIIQRELNELMFDQLLLFKHVLTWCEGDGYDKEMLLHHEGIRADYYIRLIPVQDTTSAIYVYLK